jgi:catechol 2,3-dioxygenase-like lactoylglutathione lyase family enzyme
MLPIARISHVGIGVSDLERSLRFYRDLLGFRWEHALDVQGEPTDTLLRLRGTRLHAEYLTRDGVRLELLHFASPPAPARPERPIHQYGLTHLSFRVTDIDVVLEALRAAESGARTRWSGFEAPAACFIVDPDGQLIELVQSPAIQRRRRG